MKIWKSLVLKSSRIRIGKDNGGGRVEALEQCCPAELPATMKFLYLYCLIW